jgi:putative monooxygenase
MTVNWQKEPPSDPAGEPQVVSVADTPADTRRGGDVRTLLSPKSAGSKSGFMGVATLAPGERISEHWHPFSEEFIYCVRGTITADLNDERREVKAGEALYIPFLMRHRLRNEGDEEAFIVFQLGPLAPRPDLGHVDTE